MSILTYKEADKLFKQIEEDLKHKIGVVPTPKLNDAVKQIRKHNKNLSEQIDEIFEEENEYDVEKIKRKLDMFLKTNDLQYLEKVLYLTKELIRSN